MKTLILLFISVIFFSCSKNPAPDVLDPTLPVVVTGSITSVTATSAYGASSVSSDGGADVTARGVCWSTFPNPTIALSHTSNGTGTGIFSNNVTGLSPSTTYYLRAYATNSVGTAYGTQVTFTTPFAVAVVPTLTTTAASAITNAGASSGGTISSDGGSTVTARGVCWSTATGPVASGNHTTDGTGIGTFTSSITGLTIGTTYYVRAYATNSAGTAYGNEVSFTTTGHVYLGGYEKSGLYNVGKIWDNGVATSLTNPANNGTVYTIVLSGTDLYAVGGENGGVARLWKNGVSIPLIVTQPGSMAYGVCVAGPDVYAAGYQLPQPGVPFATIWKNGVPMTITSGGGPGGWDQAYSVAVSGTNVYAVGYEAFPFIYKAKLWTNGTPTYLSNVDSWANNVVVSGTDVYISGWETNGAKKVAKVWKNGVPISLTNGLNDAHAEWVAVIGTDVYVAGIESNGTVNVAKVWKNGVATTLTDGTHDAYAESVVVVGTDVYVAGIESNGTKMVAKVWKNGVATSITDGTNDAYLWSIAVQ